LLVLTTINDTASSFRYLWSRLTSSWWSMWKYTLVWCNGISAYMWLSIGIINFLTLSVRRSLLGFVIACFDSLSCFTNYKF
jgi:hypothetical protein